MNKFILMITAVILINGCSNSLSEGNLRKATSRSTGLAEHEFIIGNRENSATSIKYDIKTNSSEIYHCSTKYAPLQGGVITSPTCSDNKGKIIKAEKEKVTF